MNPKAKKIVGGAAACVALAWLIALAAVAFRPPAPLTAVEKRLVGNWNRVDLPDEDTSADMTFLPDRTFYSNDMQCAGRWRVSGGKLRVDYHSGDWREHWSTPLRLWSDLRGHTKTCNIRFGANEREAELAMPGEPPFCRLTPAR